MEKLERDEKKRDVKEEEKRRRRRREAGKKKNKKRAGEKEAKSLKLTYYNRANNCDLRSIRRHLVSRMQFVSFFFFFSLSCSRHLASLQRKSRGEALVANDNKCLILLIIMRHDDWCF